MSFFDFHFSTIPHFLPIYFLNIIHILPSRRIILSSPFAPSLTFPFPFSYPHFSSSLSHYISLSLSPIQLLLLSLLIQLIFTFAFLLQLQIHFFLFYPSVSPFPPILALAWLKPSPCVVNLSTRRV